MNKGAISKVYAGVGDKPAGVVGPDEEDKVARQQAGPIPDDLSVSCLFLGTVWQGYPMISEYPDKQP